jgi:hypothetical protein
MARQYFNSLIADPLIVTAANISSTTTKTLMLTQAQANQCLPLPYGVNSGPNAAQVFRFALGGILTTGLTGTCIIDPIHGPGSSATAGGTDMGTSVAQTYTPSLTNAPWRLEGELIYRTISQVATTSTAWLTGIFSVQGTAATASTGWTQVFGSTAAVSVDTTGAGTLGTYGALNFFVTFSVAGSLSVTWTAMQSLN